MTNRLAELRLTHTRHATRPYLWLGFAIAVLALPSPSSRLLAQDDTNDKKPAKPTIELTIDYGDGAQKRFLTIPWEKEMTVLAALRYAKDHPHGITYEYRGKGKIAFLTQIDDVKNESGGGRNWIFYVNETRGESSFAIAGVPAAGAILWRFEEYK